jgi:hypothetical protein
MKQELIEFFDAYTVSFEESAASIAAFYSEPCITARGGNVRANGSNSDIIEFFGAVLTQYRARGLKRGDYDMLELRSLGSNSAFATIHWRYRNDEGHVLWESIFSYNLYKRGGVWKILLQTMHDDATT